ncbi:hypothetical protein [Deinococcus pimensis]|uniref:hypothetical protein n=1 Tax=Deinococcus pimensis TaxID=309888 RepID=UPI00048272C1|nr:hypothetical protein [Deinococcus pimensis]
MDFRRILWVAVSLVLLTGCNRSATKEATGPQSKQPGLTQAFAEVRTVTEDGRVRVQGTPVPEEFDRNSPPPPPKVR